MRSIKWCHFQWPWTNPNPVFKITPLTLNISQTATDSAIVTIEGEQETAPKLLNGTSFDDLEWPLSQISRSRYYSTSNNSQMVQDRAIVTLADQDKVIHCYRTAPFSMTLNNPTPIFQGQAILWRWISPRWLKIRPQLLWKVNRKTYPSFQVVLLSMTLSDL